MLKPYFLFSLLFFTTFIIQVAYCLDDQKVDNLRLPARDQNEHFNRLVKRGQGRWDRHLGDGSSTGNTNPHEPKGIDFGPGGSYFAGKIDQPVSSPKKGGSGSNSPSELKGVSFGPNNSYFAHKVVQPVGSPTKGGNPGNASPRSSTRTDFGPNNTYSIGKPLQNTGHQSPTPKSSSPRRATH